jgi:hypothetical protein
MATQLTLPKDIYSFQKNIANADGTSWLDLLDNTAGTKAVRVEAVSVTSTDASARNVQLSRLVSGVNYITGTIPVPASAGTDGTTARVVGLGSTTVGLMDADGLWVFYVPAGQKLQVKMLVAVTAAAAVCVSGTYRSYEP